MVLYSLTCSLITQHTPKNKRSITHHQRSIPDINKINSVIKITDLKTVLPISIDFQMFSWTGFGQALTPL
jgi:hypothetical protein